MPKTLENFNSEKCLEIKDWSTQNGAPAQQWSCGNNQANQVWQVTVDPDMPNVVTLRSPNSGKCLEIGDWSTANGAPARQWDCTGKVNQKWLVARTYSGWIYMNGWSGKCLEVADWSKNNGAQVRQWDCGENQFNQLWYSGV
ncbi:RICIN domain-containing protein [Streptomyces sp. NPDC029003]|uniref:RICIN domain-containing protein n=1 Tax=Streptomyces sp. NPDC029003 TaxID=3155125 RepID=UPI00340F8E0C